MIMRRMFLALCLVVVSTIAFAQNETPGGSIKGTITNGDNKPVVAATVRLKGTKKATLTNNEGSFVIENIPPGNYSVEITSIGYQTYEKEITVTSTATTDVSIRLSDGSTQLAEVIVSAGRTRESIDEVPSSVTIVGLKTLQQNLNITSNLGDILETGYLVWLPAQD